MRIDVRERGVEPYEGLVVIDADTGFKISSVVACDDEEGWVIVHKYLDHSLRPVMDSISGEYILTKIHRPIRILRKDAIPKEQRVGVVILSMVY